MIKVKTFTSVLKIFQVTNELDELDKKVSGFLNSNHIKRVISVSDTATTNVNGGTMGLIRVVAYEE